MAQEKRGFVHLYVGDGKGKTTASVGLAARARGNDNRVLFCQFLKGRGSGEVASLEKLGVVCKRALESSTKFVSQMDAAEREEVRKNHEVCLSEVRAEMDAGAFDLVVLDEVVDAVNAGIVELEALLDLVNRRPASVEIVLTGRNPHPRICDAADYYTLFACAKHPYRCGVQARRGIEF